MINVKLKSIEFSNFCGFKQLEMKFKDGENSIIGANETGKSTVSNGFLWLLTHKLADKSDKLDSLIPTFNGIMERDIIPTAKAKLLVNDKEIMLCKQIWLKFDKENNYTGNEVKYFTSDSQMACTKKDYDSYLLSIFGVQTLPADIFLLLTNLNYFCSLGENEKRSLLMPLITFKPENLFKRPDFKGLSEKYNLSKVSDELKALKQTITKQQADIKIIPNRIDENKRNIDKDTNFDSIREQIRLKQERILEIETIISGSVDPEIVAGNSRINKSISDVETIAKKKYFEAKSIYDTDNNSKLSVQRSNVSNLELLKKELAKLTIQKNNCNYELNKLESEHKTKRDEYLINRDSVIDVNSEFCATCKQPLPEDLKQAAITNFVNNKKAKKERLFTQGTQLAQQVTDKKVEITNITTEIESKNKEINELSILISKFEAAKSFTSYENSDFYKECLIEVEQLKSKLVEIKTDNTKVIDERTGLNKEILALNTILAKEKQNTDIDKRIKELESEKNKLVALSLEKQKDQDLLLEFLHESTQPIEDELNGLFAGTKTKFKMFEVVKGTQEIKPCCITLSGTNLVEYNRDNTASQFQTNINIVRVFSQKYGVEMPLFIENRDLATSLGLFGQVINLRVDGNYKTLSVI